jgi:hypothetical protein
MLSELKSQTPGLNLAWISGSEALLVIPKMRDAIMKQTTHPKLQGRVSSACYFGC